MQGIATANRELVALMCHGSIESTFISLQTAKEMKADALLKSQGLKATPSTQEKGVRAAP